MVLDVEHHENLHNGSYTDESGPNGELEEVPEVVLANTVVSEGAVVIHFEGAVLASTTVVDGPTVAADSTLEAGIINIKDLTIL